MSKQDKNNIMKGIMAAKEAIKESNFEQANKSLSSIQPIITRTQLFEFEFQFLKAALFDKEDKPKECIQAAKNAERFKPTDLNTKRLLIKSYGILKNEDELVKEILSFFEKHSNDEKQDQNILVDLIAPHLKELDEDHHDDIVLPFINCFKKLNDYSHINIFDLIPDNSDTVQIRRDLLTPLANESAESCSDLIELLLYEIYDDDKTVINDIEKFAALLPQNHQTRLMIDTFFGPDPFKSAKMYDEVTETDKFKQFIDSVESGNLPNLKKLLSYEKYFPSGWILLGDKLESGSDRVYAYSQAVKSNPCSITALLKLERSQAEVNKIDDAIVTLNKIKEIDPKVGLGHLIPFLIKHGRGDEAEKYIGNRDSLPPQERAFLIFIDYEKSGDKSLIRPIIDFPCNKDTAEVRARAALELSSELGAKAQNIFAECLKQDKENGKIYLYFARWLDNEGQEDKANFIYSKCVALGIEDDVALDRSTQQMVRNGDLDSALQICLRLNNSWSHFRAGLILQRMEKHEVACGHFQAEIGIHPDNFNAWKALGQSYFVLGRVMATMSVVQFLASKGQNDPDLDYQVSRFLERPFVVDESEIDKSPIPFFSFLSQQVARINSMFTFGRADSCIVLIDKYADLVDVFAEKWSSLAAVLKTCADFFLLAFKISKKPQFAQKAMALFKKRAEIDVRPETFIDLSAVLIEMGNIKQAIMILQKVVKKFPDSSLLWTNLGVAFCLNKETFPFARHCFCVAAMIATESELCKIYTFYSALSAMVDDFDLANQAIMEAEKAKPNDADLQLCKLVLAGKRENENNNEEEDEFENELIHLNRDLDLALLSFEYGPSPQLIENIPKILLKLNRNTQALGFALMSNNNKLIEMAYEALGKYEMALTFVDDGDEETKSRLLALLGKSQERYKIADLLNSNNYSAALEQLMSQKSGNKTLNEITEAVCLSLLNRNEEAVKKLRELRDTLLDDQKSEGLLEAVNKLLLKLDPNEKVKIGRTKDYQLLYLRELKKSKNDKGLASKKLLKICKNDPNAFKIYLINALFNGNKNGATRVSTSDILNNATTYALVHPSRESYLFLMTAFISAKKYFDALITLQKLCVLQPEMIVKSRDLMNMLSEKVEGSSFKQKRFDLNKASNAKNDDYDDYEEDDDNDDDDDDDFGYED